MRRRSLCAEAHVLHLLCSLPHVMLCCTGVHHSPASRGSWRAPYHGRHGAGREVARCGSVWHLCCVLCCAAFIRPNALAAACKAHPYVACRAWRGAHLLLLVHRPLRPRLRCGLPHVSTCCAAQESIKSSQSWFMACAAYADGMALAMARRALALPDFDRILHLIYMANDILVKRYACLLPLS